MNRISIRTKMLVGISIPVVLVLTLAGFSISRSVGSSVIELSTQKLSAEAQAVSNQISDFFTKYLEGTHLTAANSQIEQFAKDTKKGDRMEKEESYLDVKRTLENSLATDKQNMLFAWLGDFDSSQMTQSDGYTTPDGWDITSRPWYQVSNTLAPLMTEPYADASTGLLIVTAASPILDTSSGKAIGAIGFDIKLDKLGTIIGSHKIGEKGFLVLCSSSGLIVYHPDSQYIQKNISESNFSDNIKSAISSGTAGSYTYEMNGSPYMGSVSSIGNTGWLVLTGLPESEALSIYHTTIKLILLTFGCGLILLIACVLFISAGITKPMKKLALSAQRIANGELDVQVEVKSMDETGQVASAISKTVDQLKNYINYINEISDVLNHIADGKLVFTLKQDYAGEFAKIKNSLLRIRQTLTTTITDITHSAGEVLQGSSQIASGSQALAQGATEQASSVEELAATITKVSDHVKRNADNAMKANDRAIQMSGQLTQSSSQMRCLSSAITEISASSSQIGNIIKTIEDIAFQTNILALNAAVEAARAGAAGKGFAVVADEVRNLAGKSSQAVKHTSALIAASVASVENGTKIADETENALAQVVESAKFIVSAIAEISAASNEQAVSLSQVSEGVSQISSVVQTNSATAEQSAAASQELSGQSHELKRLVEKFTIGEENESQQNDKRLRLH